MVEKPRYKCRFLNLGVIKGQCLAAVIVRLDNHKRLGVPNGKPTVTSRVLRIDFEKKEMETYNSIYRWENE